MKKVQVIWTDKSPKAAKKAVRSILKRTRQLETFPESGSPQETVKTLNHSFRYLVEGHYKIVYSVEGKALYVEAVVDTRQLFSQ